jgi:hypothetical protein
MDYSKKTSGSGQCHLNQNFNTFMEHLSDENTAFYVSLFFIIINFQIFNKNKKYSKKCL